MVTFSSTIAGVVLAAVVVVVDVVLVVVVVVIVVVVVVGASILGVCGRRPFTPGTRSASHLHP
jgi:hypothetical protein